MLLYLATWSFHLVKHRHPEIHKKHYVTEIRYQNSIKKIILLKESETHWLCNNFTKASQKQSKFDRETLRNTNFEYNWHKLNLGLVSCYPTIGLLLSVHKSQKYLALLLWLWKFVNINVSLVFLCVRAISDNMGLPSTDLTVCRFVDLHWLTTKWKLG